MLSLTYLLINSNEVLHMGFFKRKRTPNYDFTDEDRKHAAELKRLRADTRKFEQEKEILRHKIELEQLKQDMQDLKGYNDEPDSDSGSTPEMMLMALLAQVLSNRGTSQTASFGTSATPPPTAAAENCQELSDEQIQEYLSQIPKKYLKKLKLMDDGNKAALIRSYFKGLGADSVNRAVTAINAL